jgi:hypothetical protein
MTGHWKLPLPGAATAAPAPATTPVATTAPQKPQETPVASPPSDTVAGDIRPLRLSWRDFPPEYAAALRSAATNGSAQLGPMSWNDARFSQREFYRLVAVLRRNVSEGDTEAAPLDDIARQLRVSVPRCDHDLTKHWFILKANPLVKAMRGAAAVLTLIEEEPC